MSNYFNKLINKFKIVSYNDRGILVKKYKNHIDFLKENQCIRISKRHEVYHHDIITSFDYYFNAVMPLKRFNFSLVDYSKPKYHSVCGFLLHKIIFPSFAEPLSTTNQYLDFSELNENSVVLDLGAYSGLTSILFDMQIANGNKNVQGKVIAVDPDTLNSKCIRKNLSLYKKKTGRNIEFLEAAVWEHNDGVELSVEGNMGSYVTELAQSRCKPALVKSCTLGVIAEKFSLDRVDFIKCDIEGGEIAIFKDENFFKKYQPKIIIETHTINNQGIMSTETVIKQLSKFGYQCEEVIQDGVALPLLKCIPTE